MSAVLAGGEAFGSQARLHYDVDDWLQGAAMNHTQRARL
jgi:hypothetical protein